MRPSIPSHLSRRGFLKALGVSAGALAGTRLGGGALIGRALAASPEPTALVMIWLNGGINAIFTGADAFTNTAFGVTGNNVTALGGGVVVDNSLGNAIPQSLRTRVASVGIRHGIADHGQAQTRAFVGNGVSGPLALANAIGGTGAIKAAVAGGNSLPNGVRPTPIGAVSLQGITDMQATIDAVAGAKPSPNTVDRDGARAGIEVADAMSSGQFSKAPKSLSSIEQGFDAAAATLAKPVQPFNVAEFNTAYALQGTGVRSFASKMAAAELMVRSGTNFVLVEDGGWDTHGDTNGNTVRNQFTQRISGALRTFLTRAVEGTASERNVMVALMGDFHRSLPGSDHQANVAALVIGKRFKNGTTGKTAANVGLAPTTPGIDGFWQLMGAAAKLDTSPFGANPHTALLA
ncbi:MAG: DUF1501 domain-containing protein [Deltaproteobacteria bacterium]|nr:DUF1501 domain-containing protein [Deltaproteobacteria bacterium]